jgi:hypothetical protein
MSESPDWPSAFLATSVLLGEPRDAAVTALGDAATRQSSKLEAALASPSRESRAHALARVLAAVAANVERTRLA